MDHSFDYENNTPEQDPDIPTPNSETVPPVNETAPEPPAEVERPNGEYRFVPAPERRSPYSDADYVSSDTAGAVPKSYYCATPPAEKNMMVPQRILLSMVSNAHATMHCRSRSYGKR